ncbi:major facilitator superfamily domain-containing protein [Amylocarpus encephaloides]|uniref:Major facilitator superfamily domain-containing protein n=1 Tax=Amylocarpus encephaloides TaxID=45428 RepID=A0A9P7Y8V1_9HELO|nr:major facilitator superfamily domain-containing protein [Amylocarpus encephaloides]
MASSSRVAGRSDELHIPPPEISPNSSETSHTRLTPNTDSEESDQDELAIGGEELGGGESYRMRSIRAEENEKLWSEGDSESESGVDKEAGDIEDDRDGGRRRRASMSTVQSYQLYTPDEEREVVRIFDKKLVLFVALLYMLSFLDRSNIGNAKIAGLDLDLELDTVRYQWVITAFYISYISFEWMSVLWKLIPAHIYVTAIVLSWGLVASLQSITTSFAGLLVLRVLLGIGEAGFTGIPFYLSFFFKRDELALRTGYFISAAPLATSFASSLAWAIIKLGKHTPIASWRLLFLLEGFPSVLVAVVAWHIIPDSPSTAPYLTKRQKRVARLRLRSQTSSSTAESRHLSGSDILKTLKSPRIYLTSLIFFLTNLAFSSLPVFLPTIIHEMGHSVSVSQALSAPPYLLSFAVVLLTSYLSDRLKSRSHFIVLHALLSASGYLLLALSPTLGLPPTVRYLALFPASVGFFSVVTLTITWNINNESSESGRGAGFAVMQVIGQCGPLIGTRLYPDEEAPYYVWGMGVCAGSMVVVAVLTTVLREYLRQLNLQGEGREEVEYGKIGEDDRDGTRDGRAFRYYL